MAISALPADRLRRANELLIGLSVGDALGGFFEFGNRATLERYMTSKTLPPSPWHFTDDTNMALSIYAILRQFGSIDQDKLALSFARHYDRGRGYGPAMHGVMRRINDGQTWQAVARELFEGQGSYGNGGAMRITPLGAYFADDLDLVVEQACLSAEITHTHPEGIAGGIAVAVAAAYAARLRGEPAPSRPDFIDLILPHIPNSIVSEKLRHARQLAPGSSVQLAVSALGNGSQISAQDTVPFCLWCAGEQLAHYEQAIWLTASGMGDVDTTCAIVGGIVSAYTGAEAVPADWIARRESLPDWAFTELI